MTGNVSQTNLVGFAGHESSAGETELKAVMRDELKVLRDLFGPRLTTVSSITTLSDLAFLKCCVELRIPAILILPDEPEHLSKSFTETDWNMARHLMSVSLACYVAPGQPSETPASSLILEWADVLLCVQNESAAHSSKEALEDATALGVPSRIIDDPTLETRWSFPPDPTRSARHGFETRKELLEFFDTRLGRPLVG
jgi:hypothetical protein